MSARKIALGAVIGMATGAVLGVLFAPDKGSATRKKLSNGVSRNKDALKNTASEYMDNLEGKLERVRDTAVGLSDRVKGAVDSLIGPEPLKHPRRPKARDQRR